MEPKMTQIISSPQTSSENMEKGIDVTRDNKYEYTEADRELLLSRFSKFYNIAGDTTIPLPEDEWTLGAASDLGISTVENSPLSSAQFLFTLAMSHHPLMGKVAKEGLPNSHLDFEPLIQAQVLAGMKIIDLGCGHIPMYERAARALGADILTVDIFPAEQFRLDAQYKHSPVRKGEIEKHKAINLRSPDWVDRILEWSGGNFDLVTEAHLTSDGTYLEKSKVEKLLKEGGIYFDAGSYPVFLIKPKTRQ